MRRAAWVVASAGRSSGRIRASRSNRARRLSTVWRSARTSSVLTVSMSSPGFTRPSTWATSGSSKTRTTWHTASESRMLARNLLPSPCPVDAPRTRPAMSTKLTVAGTTLAEENISARRASLESGTGTTPTFGSIVANG